jgi:PAS domain S-box-containing protein
MLPAMLGVLTDAGVGVVVFAVYSGRLVKAYANDAGVRPFGYTGDEWLTTPVGHTLAPKQRDTIMNMYERLANEGTPPNAMELTFLHRDGHEVRGEVSLARVPIPDGVAMITIVRGTGQMLDAQMSLLEADRLSLVGALAAGFAHETNNPLTSVLLNLRSLRKQLAAGNAELALRCADDITTGAERIASNVRALQTLATRSATGDTDVAAVVSAVLRLAAPTLESRAIVIRQVFPTEPVTGEESRIAQAVLAMLLFACSGFDVDTSGTSNRIVVTVEERAGSIVIEVTDNGRELNVDDANRAFDPFYRSQTRGAGVGVGLGVARSVATALGGDFALAPREGGGAVITMRLPRRA